MTEIAPSNELARHGLFSRIGFSAGGQIVYSLGQLGVLSSLSLMHGAEAAGMFGFAFAIVTPLFILANLGLRTSQVVDQEGLFKFEEYFGYRAVTTALAFLVCLIGSVFLIDHPTIRWIVILYAGAKTFEAVSLLCYATFERSERFDLVFRSLLIRSVLTFFVFVGLLFAGAPIWVAFFAQLIVWAVNACLLDIRSVREILPPDSRLRPSISMSRFGSLTWRTFPIGGAGFLSGMQLALLRIIVESQLGLAALGIFTNVSYIFHAGAMLAHSVRHVLGARFSKLRVSRNFAATWRVIFTVFSLLMATVLIGLAFVQVFGVPLLRILFGPETSEEGRLFLIVAVALGLRLLAVIPTSLIHAYGGIGKQFLREFVFLSIIAVFSVPAISIAGLEGAGWMLVVVSAARLLADGLQVWLRWRRRQND
ncbi:MAG: hypothetical protein AAFY09_09900 [Pseudomonadota bacterium]